MNHVIALAVGFFLDLLIGDPRWLYHPICLVGNGIAAIEKRVRKAMPETQKGELMGGFLEVLLVCGLSYGVPYIILRLCYKILPVMGLVMECFWCYQLLAARSLKDESMKVWHKLENGTLEDARYAVSMIVGRDTKSLTREGVIKAAVETVAESTSDGVIAPAFYMAVGGVPLMFLYKGINTMDSMLGYKNEKYFYYGRCAAKLDDLANYIPSRIAGHFMVAAAWLMNGKSASDNFSGISGRNAAAIYKRDRRNHASPNSAQTESAMAGALQVQLAGDAWYFGKLYKKPTIGDAVRPVEAEDIKRSNQLMYGTAVLGVIAFLMIRLAFFLW